MLLARTLALRENRMIDSWIRSRDSSRAAIHAILELYEATVKVVLRNSDRVALPGEGAPIRLVPTAVGSADSAADGPWPAWGVRPAEPSARGRTVMRPVRFRAEVYYGTGVPAEVSTRPGRSRPAGPRSWRSDRCAA
ncbi:hypothetical protein SGFS_089880 [Streptomyces graminofaciens]|uniref:Transposase n=1 Tax=Streptomyces graminofaciens TaxID=68212 RepID=A0ABN5VWF7_9ACTN|nr:hypothetical protein SGFS_089880 [Streptomyces graminofaciens]